MTPDKIRNNVITNISDIVNREVKFKIIQNERGEKGLLVLIAKRKDLALFGGKVIIRDGASFRSAVDEEIIEKMKDHQETQCGHLWIKSLRSFVVRNNS